MKSPKLVRDWQEIALYGIFFLFFFQLITDFVEAIYAFGLMGTEIPAEIVAVVLLLSPLLLIFFGGSLPNWVLIAAGEAALVARVVEIMLNTRGRLIVSGIGAASFLIWLPALIQKIAKQKHHSEARNLSLGLIYAVAGSVALRASGSGVDVSTDGPWQVLGWVLAAGAAVLLIICFKPTTGATKLKIENGKAQKAGFWRASGLSTGIMAVLMLLYFAFASPNVIARWTGAGYSGVAALLAFSLSLFGYLFLLKRRWFETLSGRIVMLCNLIFLAALALTIGAHQVNFPAGPQAYPFFEPSLTLFHQIPLILMLLLFPIVMLNFWRYLCGMLLLAPSSRVLGGAFSLASLFALVMILSHAFTTTYDYIPVIGTFFRDKFWLVHLVVGAAACLPLFLVGEKQPMDDAGREEPPPATLYWVSLAALSLLALLAVWLTSARPSAASPSDGTFTVLTYNIQQGYSQDGLKNYDGQLALIRSLDPDIIGLQESDTNRIANGNADLVRYFADQLNMYSYYGPKTVPGTFGIALLSKYPIREPKTFYMYSTGEQTAAIQAGIEIGGQRYQVFVTHLGNGGPIFQQEGFLTQIDGQDHVIAMGDFNFRPESEQYRITVDLLVDAWLQKWPSGVDDQGVDPVDRIDHIFLSPGIEVLEASYLFSPQSDHPAFVITIAQ